MKKALLSIFALAVLMVVSTIGNAQTTYTKINSVAELEAGAKYILVGYNNDGQAFVMSYQKTNNRHAIQVSEDGSTITTEVATSSSSQTEAYEFTLGGSAGEWTIFDPLFNGYLCAPGGGNYLKTQSTVDDKSKWTITEGENGGFVPVSNGGVEQNYMRYNKASTLFGCYKASSTTNDPVYFFKAGEPVVNPEPTNYPTNFVAIVDDLKITLQWDDATGGQLPNKYLVVGSTSEIEVPVDGRPVENGELVLNVGYGVEQVTFYALEGNTTYHFAIFPYSNSGDAIDYKTDGQYPTAQGTTPEIDKLIYEDFDNGLGVFTEYSRMGEQVWQQATYNGITYADMNGYASGTSYENEDWLISPEIPFSRDAITLEFRTAKKYGDETTSLRVMVSSDFNGGDPGTDGYWEDITDMFAFSTENFEWVESGQVNIQNLVNNQLGFFHIAFVYTSTATAAAHWEIDYVRVLSGMVSVDEQETASLNVYPNPAHETVSFNLESDAQVSVYDMTGRMVSVMHKTAGEVQYPVAGFESGVYFLNIRYSDGTTQVVRFVKY